MTKSKIQVDYATALKQAAYIEKSCPITITKSPTDGSGRVIALVSTFGPPPDLDGDIVNEGAFDEWLADARAERPGALIPVLWQHGIDNPENAIGRVLTATTTSKGLFIDAQLDIDTSPRAMSVYESLLTGTLKEWSISYGILAQHKGAYGNKTVNFLDKVFMLEVSVVVKGANEFTQTLSVKSPAPTRAVPNEIATLKARLAELEVPVRAGVAPDPAVVDAFISQARAEAARKKADHAALQALSLINQERARAMAREEPGAEAARDAERAAREADLRARREREREEERALLDAADAARRESVRNDPRTFTP